MKLVSYIFICIVFATATVFCAPESYNVSDSSSIESAAPEKSTPVSPVEGSVIAKVPTGRTFLRPISNPSQSHADAESEDRHIPLNDSPAQVPNGQEPSILTLTGLPGVDGQGRWFFDWFWGYDQQPQYPPPLVPRPAPVYPHPYPPDVPLEVCHEMHDPMTLDIYEECYPLDRTD